MENYRKIDRGNIALATLSFGGNYKVCSNDDEDDDSASVHRVPYSPFRKIELLAFGHKCVKL